MACAGRGTALDPFPSTAQERVPGQIIVFIFWILSGPFAIQVGNNAKKCKENNFGRHCGLYDFYYWGYWIAGGLGIALYTIAFFSLLGWLGMLAAIAAIKKGKELLKVKSPLSSHDS